MTSTPTNKKLVFVNVVSSGGQVVLIGLVYFFLYRVLLHALNVELLGVWSVVLSTSSIANLANFGVADSVLRFVALYNKQGDGKKMHQLIFTASLFLLGLFGGIALIAYPFADFILKAVLPAKYINQALLILPYSLLCLIINAVNGVLSSVLDGLQRNYIRNIIYSVSSLALLFSTYLLVGHYGLQGVAFAQVIQSLFVLFTCLFFVILKTSYNPLKWYWSRDVFKQIFSYGVKFQFISLANMLNEPIIKILLGKLGGMAFVGYYEMANRLVMQVRGVIVNATQSLIPVMVNLRKDVAEVQVFYKKIFSNILFFLITTMCTLIISGKLISFYWIGHLQPIFYYTFVFLTISVLLSLFTVPAYFFYMAEGDLNVLIKNHLILGLSNAVFATVLGLFWHGYGVIMGWMVAMMLSTIYMLQYFNNNYSLRYQNLFKKNDIVYTLIMVVIMALNFMQIIKGNFKIIDSVYFIIAFIVAIIYFFKFKVNDIFSSRAEKVV